MVKRNEGKKESLRVFSGGGNIQDAGRPKERVVGRSRKNHRYLWRGVLRPQREAAACAWLPHHTTPSRPPALRRQEVRCLLVGGAGAPHVGQPSPPLSAAIKGLHLSTLPHRHSSALCAGVAWTLKAPHAPTLPAHMMVTNLPPAPVPSWP